jgi:hypothetical protein
MTSQRKMTTIIFAESAFTAEAHTGYARISAHWCFDSTSRFKLSIIGMRPSYQA